MKIDEKDLRTIGANVRAERKRQGLSQDRLATMLGYTSHTFLSNVENGKKKPSLSMLFKLSEIFEVDINYFFTKI